MMRSIFITLAILSATCTTSRSQSIDGVESVAQDRQAKATSKNKGEEFSLRELNITRARATFPEAKRRFLAGLPVGYELFVEAEPKEGFDGALIAVDNILSSQIVGHWPASMQAATYEETTRAYILSEEYLTDWIIVRPDGVTEGNFHSRLLGPLGAALATDTRSATGATCGQARLALESLTRSEAIKICAASDSARLCGNGEGVWDLSCHWDKDLHLYRAEGMRIFGCCL